MQDFQEEFDFIFQHNHPFLLIEEASDAMRCSDQTVRNRIDEGTVLAFALNVEDKPERERLLVVRATAVPDYKDCPEWADLIATIDQWLFPHRRLVVTVREVALSLHCSGWHVRCLWEARQLGSAFSISNPKGEKQHLRFKRSEIVAFVRRRLIAKVGAVGGVIETKGKMV